jgi:hypothetical protein
MELVLTQQNAEPFPINKFNSIHNKPLGLLTSEYKAVAKSNYHNFNKQSLFGMRQAVKSQFYNSTCVAEVTLKLSLFLILFLMIFSF